MTQTTFEVPRSGFIREYIYVGLRPFESTTEGFLIIISALALLV